MQKKIILVTGDNAFFGQARKPWASMNVATINSILENAGYEIERRAWHEMVNIEEPVHDAIIFYTFHQKANNRQYIKDMIFLHDNGTNLILPSKELLNCHENKGYQEILKKRLGIKSLKAFYFSSIGQIANYNIEYPVVLKGDEGSNGTQVFLIHSEQELKDKVKKEFTKRSFGIKMDLLRRKYLRSKKTYAEYPNYSNEQDYAEYAPYITTHQNFILQEFVPDRDCDYRILALGNKYFAIKRMTRKNDFRASGAKKFIADFPLDKRMLEYTKDLYHKLNTPFVSIDLCEKDGQFYLVEFQALHFGVNVLVKTKGYYDSEKNWEFVEQVPHLEKSLAEGLLYYLENTLKTL